MEYVAYEEKLDGYHCTAFYFCEHVFNSSSTFGL